MDDTSRVTGFRLAAAGRFAALKFLDWVDAKGVQRVWESAERINDAGAVMIIARLRPSNRLLLIRQFRPPARIPVMEFPAGLMEAGESAEQAAARELREETGYAAAITAVHPPAYTTPGLSNESVYVVEADIDENAPENRIPETNFDPSEMIESICVDYADLVKFYRRETEKGVAFDAKLAAYIIAFEQMHTQ